MKMIAEEKSLLHVVGKKDKKGIKKWEDDAASGKTMRIM